MATSVDSFVDNYWFLYRLKRFDLLEGDIAMGAWR